MTVFGAAFLALLALSGAQSPATGDIPEHGAGTCTPKPVAHLVGRSATKKRIDWAKKRSTATSMRVFRQGKAVTQDYRTDRLNVVTDNRNVIRKIYCG